MSDAARCPQTWRREDKFLLTKAAQSVTIKRLISPCKVNNYRQEIAMDETNEHTSQTHALAFMSSRRATWRNVTRSFLFLYLNRDTPLNPKVTSIVYNVIMEPSNIAGTFRSQMSQEVPVVARANITSLTDLPFFFSKFFFIIYSFQQCFDIWTLEPTSVVWNLELRWDQRFPLNVDRAILTIIVFTTSFIPLHSSVMLALCSKPQKKIDFRLENKSAARLGNRYSL